MPIRSISLLALAAALAWPAWAQESVIRKNLAERLPELPKIDEVTKTKVPGLWEVRVGHELFYTDEQGNHLIQGTLFDTKAKINLTEQRLDKLTAIDFKQLPLKDAMVVKQGTGARKLAVFADPNCGYCKRFERDLQKVDNVTIHMFLYPILGPDSADKSRNIWCAKDKGKAWMDFMVRDQAVPAASCDTAALTRNLDYGKRHKISGTPTLVFVDGTRVPGAIGAPQVEKLLAEK